MKSTKHPLLVTYIHTPDNGQELRYSLRSVINITNWNREVYVVGDLEPWFNNIHHIPSKRIYGKPYGDQIAKLYHAAKIIQSDKVIVSMDDVYIIKNTKIGFYHKGLLQSDTVNYYRRTKLNTIHLLKENGIDDPIDHEVHYPFLVERDKFIETLELILRHRNRDVLQWRSIYGNIYKPKSITVKDYKTKTAELKKGNVISTQFYTSELDKIFPEDCEFEAEYVV